MYGMDEDTITSILKNKIARRDIVKIELAKWFEMNKDSNSYQLKYEKLNEVKYSMLKFPYQDKVWNDVSLAFGVKINEINWSQIK